MLQILLKKAGISDFEEVASLERNAKSKTYNAFMKDAELKDFINDNEVFLIESDGVIVGLIAYRTVTQKIAHIMGLIVKPAFRGHGIAREAMSMLLKKLISYSRIELEVHPHNNSAVRLYLSLNFIIESWKDDCFGDGEPRLIMIRKNI